MVSQGVGFKQVVSGTAYLSFTTVDGVDRHVDCAYYPQPLIKVLVKVLQVPNGYLPIDSSLSISLIVVS